MLRFITAPLAFFGSLVVFHAIGLPVLWTGVLAGGLTLFIFFKK